MYVIISSPFKYTNEFPWTCSLQEETGRPVASSKEVDCAELVLDVSPKTQRVILKKKVQNTSKGIFERHCPCEHKGKQVGSEILLQTMAYHY